MAGCYSRKEALWLLSQSFCFYPITPTRKTYSPPKRLLLHTHFYTEHPLSSRVDACKRAEAHECMHNPAVCSFACCGCWRWDPSVKWGIQLLFTWAFEFNPLTPTLHNCNYNYHPLLHIAGACSVYLLSAVRFSRLQALGEIPLEAVLHSS